VRERYGEKKYLAVTNKRFLLADVDGVYSFTNPKISREVKYLLAVLFIESIIITLIALAIKPIIAMIYFPIISIFALIILAAQWNRIRISAYGKFYKSNFKWTIEGWKKSRRKQRFLNSYLER